MATIAEVTARTDPMADPIIEDDDLPGDPPPKATVKPTAPPKKVEPEPEPEVKKHTHTSRLVALARAAGFTQDDLDNHPSDVIWEELDRIGATAKPTPAPKEEPKKVEVDPEEAYLAELESTHAPLANMLRQSKAKLAAMEKAQAEKDEVIGKLTQAEQKRQDKMRERWVDAGFAALGEEYESLIGTGPIAKLTDPGSIGWRSAIYKEAGLTMDDTAETVIAKIVATGKKKAAGHIKTPEKVGGAYDTLPSRKPQPKDANGRFTAEDFEKGHVHKPGGKTTAADPLDDVEQARRYFKEIGDPRGNHAGISLDDDDLPG